MPGRYLSIKKKSGKRMVLRRRPRRYRKAGPRLYRGHGGFNIVRKLPLMTITSASVAGLYTLNDPTGTCITLGTPSAAPGTTGLYDIPFSMKFSLNQLQTFTDITQIADQYYLNNVLVKLVSGFQAATGVGAPTPWVEYIQDKDDAAVPTLAQMRQKMGVKTKFFGPTRTRIQMGVRPRVADEVFSSGITTGYAVGARVQWINCDYPAVEHYGIKGILHNVYSNGTSNQGLLTFDVSFKVSAKDLQ